MSENDLHLLFGRDPTPGIVAVWAGRNGRARVWRRIAGEVVAEFDSFLNWCILPNDRYLARLPRLDLPAGADLEAVEPPAGGVAVLPLAGDHHYRLLVLTRDLGAVEEAICAAYHAETGRAARSLYDLRGVAFVRPAVEQYLIFRGRTYFKGMAYADLRRLQFDLETTDLDPRRGQIFMIAMADSTGWSEVLEVGQGGERDLIERFVARVAERDPDVLENHNLFDFDLPWLEARAAVHRLRLALGRDGGPPTRYRDTLKIGENTESFTRYSVVGREIVDTLHAVKRYGAIVRDLRHHGLKEAARYFGVAPADREYLEGGAIWATYQSDPERVRRYALADVHEVGALSRVLLAPSFALASMVPKPYERVATSGTGQGLIEPLLVRAYFDLRHSLPSGDESGATGYEGARTELFTSGVVSNVVKADVASLYPSIMLTYGIGPRSDQPGVFLRLLRQLTDLRLQHKALARAAPPESEERFTHETLQSAMKVLINSFYGSLGTSFALFGDVARASEVTARGREILGKLLHELERRGVTLIEADTDGVLFSVPAGWSEADERRLVEEVGATLPSGIRVEYDGRYRRMYSYAEKNYVLEGYDGRIKIVGGAFRSAKSERYGERFLREVLPLLLAGDLAGVRERYVRLVADLRAGRVPLEDLCVTMPLTKSPAEYERARRKEEQYEVLKAAGRSWEPGERVRYYQAKGGVKRLLDDAGGEPDVEHYVQKLRTTYAARLARAFSPDDFAALFAEPGGLFEPDLARVQLVAARGRPAPAPLPADNAEG